MDAASNIKSFLVALAAVFGTVSSANSDDAETASPCKSKQCQTAAGLAVTCVEGGCSDGRVCESDKCPASKCSTDSIAPDSFATCDATASGKSSGYSGFAASVSEWLSNSPKFSAEVAIHFGASPQVRDVPVDVYGQTGQTGRFSVGDLVNSNLEVAGNFVLKERNFDLLNRPRDLQTKASRSAVPPIAKPMRFTERIPRIQLRELFSDVIVCGHRICSGNKCYDVKDEPVAGIACDKTGEADANESAEVEQILELPMAPPAPPGESIAFDRNADPETEAASILRNSGLGGVNISLPVTTVVDLLMAKTELSTRLEMTGQLMDERQMAMEQIQSLAHRNATLSTQLAVAEARNQMSDALTASVVDRAELAIKLATFDTKSAKLQGTNSVVQTIQEDLSNIRRQIALLRKSPIPFAPSYVGTQTFQPYVPTAQLPVPQMKKDSEATCSGDETECVDAITLK
ncbi:MAG TPA: hypothetical protein VM260_18440 [Pirellula sp.]|nr:hypothetical protein [Pirellula sp.]